MAARKPTNPISQNWYEEPIKKWFAIISGFIAVASMGYGIATVKLNLEFRMEKFEMQQDFNEKLREQIDNCRTEKQNYENKRVEDIEEGIKNLEKKVNGK